MKAQASIKNLKVSPKKLNFLVDLIREKPVDVAQRLLQFSTVRVSTDVSKCLNAAISNAENNHGMDISKLVIIRVDVGKSMVLKRFRARARGRGSKIFKPFSHLRIVVVEKKGSN